DPGRNRGRGDRPAGARTGPAGAARAAALEAPAGAAEVPATRRRRRSRARPRPSRRSSGGCRASRFSEVVGGPNAFAPDLHTGLRLAAELRLAAVGVASGLAHPVEGGAEAALGAARGGT